MPGAAPGRIDHSLKPLEWWDLGRLSGPHPSIDEFAGKDPNPGATSRPVAAMGPKCKLPAVSRGELRT